MYKIPNVLAEQKATGQFGFGSNRILELPEIREGTHKGRLSACLGKEGSKRTNTGTERWRMECLYWRILLINTKTTNVRNKGNV